MRERVREGGDGADVAAAMRFARLEGLGLLDRAFTVVDLAHGRPTGQALKVVRWAIDAAFDSWAVYRFARRHLPRVQPVAGRDSKSMRTPTRVVAIDKTPDGRAFAGGLTLMLFDAEHHRDIAYPALLRETPAPGATRWPENYELGHARQLTAEHRVTETSKRGAVTRWELKPGRRDNHFFDCRVINTVLGETVVRPYLRTHGLRTPARPSRIPGFD
jgi:phage terminase large subunit GpA-like protein